MKTAHGVEMSPRFERLHLFLQARKIQLSTWSTDQCVEREFQKLQAAADFLRAALDGSGPIDGLEKMTRAQVEALAEDVAAYMRRRPQNRVG